MSFSCPPSELVNHILEALAFSGFQGITLSQLWTIVDDKLQSETDDFQKQIIWMWLFFGSSSNNTELFVKSGDTKVSPSTNYRDFVQKVGIEKDIRIFPNADIQWKFLTGFDVSKRMRLQLGDYPFQLLCEISKHGSDGIFSPDLCKATGQDPRSLPLRLKKLEELGLIKKRNVYNEKLSQHTSICFHSKFAGNDFDYKATAGSSDFDISRNGQKLKLSILNAVKEAPNNLRGFKDLKSELGLDKSKSTNKFFRGVVEYLHNHGYVERLMVKDPNGSHLVYCIKFIKDIPKDSDILSDEIDLLDLQGDLYPEDDGADGVNETKLLKLNKFFPLISQFYEEMDVYGASGITSMEVIRLLSGVSDYRPFFKILDSVTNFVIDGKNLKALKPFANSSLEKSIIRAYDFESKFKFYRYFTKNHVSMKIDDKSPRLSDEQMKSEESIEILNKKLFIPLTKTPKGTSLSTNKRKMKPTPHQKSKKLKTKTADASSELVVTSKEPGDIHQYEDKLSNIDHKEPLDPSKLPSSKQKKIQGAKIGSLKANKRRTALIDIIKSFGGVTYTTTNLCRLLDEKLGNVTVTDKKTLARDVSILINTGDIEVRDISFTMSGQQVSRKLLILTSSESKPSESKIEEVRRRCIDDNGNKLNSQINRRTIESEVTLYRSSQIPSKKKESKKGRLESLTEQETSTTPSKDKNLRDNRHDQDERKESQSYVTSALDNNDDPLSAYLSKRQRKRKRAIIKKAPNSENFISSSRRYRTTVKFDEADMATLFRSVIISKAFKKGTIDFENIAALFTSVSPKEVKQKWTLIRKQIGGLPSVTKVTESFEHIVMKGIEDGLVTTSDLKNIDFNFFLDFWKANDTTIIDIVDNTPLFSTPSKNYESYYKVEQGDNYQDLYEQVEENSMRQKESILSGVSFCYEALKYPNAKPHEDLRGLLKAIFATPQDKFNSQKVKTLLSKFDEEAIQEVTSQLIGDKEISYHSDHSETSFVLTDKINNSFVSRIFVEKFFYQAAEFERNLTAISESSKGLILSQGISNGEVGAVLSKISDGSLNVIRVDKSYIFNGYESRLIDKDKLSCNIIVWSNSDMGHSSLDICPVPTGASCSHIWLDLEGNVNVQMWIKILISMVYYIHFRPGIPGATLHRKLGAVLSNRDFHAVTNWLVKTKGVVKGDYDGYWIQKDWFCMLG